jgi:hypothetical protein
MWPRAILILALATALRGVPSVASAAGDGAGAEPSLDGTTVTLAAGAATVTVGGIVLLVARRRRAGDERRAAATQERVTAALMRRTLDRGRLRFDDNVVAGSRTASSPTAPSRPKRRTG